jgi:hypothetical protein
MKDMAETFGNLEPSSFSGRAGRFLALFFSIWIPFFIAVGSDAKRGYEGRWWISIGKDQQTDFLEGYLACHSGLTTNDEMQFKESNRAYYRRLTAYFQAHRESLNEPVELILWKVASPPLARPAKEPPGGEGAGEKWGVLDGEYWHLDSDLGRLGFVQGFLECYTRRTKQEQGTFSKPSAWYAAAITKWYGINPENPSAIDPDRENTKIPEVLFRFHD